MNTYKIHILLICLIHLHIKSNEYLLQKYRVSPEINQLLDLHSEEISAAFNLCEDKFCIKKHKVYQFPWLNSYVIKVHGARRINGLERMRHCIESNNLSLLVIPDTKLYHRKNKSTKLKKNNYLAIMPKFSSIPDPKPFNIEQVKQLWTFILTSGYDDLTPANYARLTNDRIVIIDTEWHSFESNFPYKQFKGLSQLIIAHHPWDYDEDAFRFILTELVKYIPEELNIPHKVHPFVNTNL